MSSISYTDPHRVLSLCFTLIVLLCILPASHALTANDTLGAWRAASNETKAELAKTMVRRLGEGRISERQIKLLALQVFLCINETAGSGGLDDMRIAEVAAGCIALLGKQ